MEALREVGLGRVPRLARVPELRAAKLLEAHGDERSDAVFALKYQILCFEHVISFKILLKYLLSIEE